MPRRASPATSSRRCRPRPPKRASRSSGYSTISSGSSFRPRRTGTIRASSPTSRPARRRWRSRPRRLPRRSTSKRCSGARRPPRPSSRKSRCAGSAGCSGCRRIGRHHLRHRVDSGLYGAGGRARIARPRDSRTRHGRAQRCRRCACTSPDETHSHVEKAAIALGVGRENVVRVPCDERSACVPKRCDAAIERRSSRTGCGRWQSSRPSARRRRPRSIRSRRSPRSRAEHGVWLHVDAAYAGIAAIVPEFRSLLDGRRARRFARRQSAQVDVRSDGLSVLFVKDESIGSPRVQPRPRVSDDAGNRRRQLHGLRTAARAALSRAQAVVRACATSAPRAFETKLRGHIALAQEFAAWVRRRAAAGRSLAPHPLSVVCFRYAPPGCRRGSARSAQRRDHARRQCHRRDLPLAHKIDGSYAIRLAIGNLRTQRADVETAWEILRREAATLTPDRQTRRR